MKTNRSTDRRRVLNALSQTTLESQEILSERLMVPKENVGTNKTDYTIMQY